MTGNHKPARSGPKFSDGIKPEWAPKVPPQTIQRMYANAARGLEDAELIAMVGWQLFVRCKSIFEAIEATHGRAPCPRCETIIPHRRQWHERLQCSTCGWQTTWGAYRQTIDGKGLIGGGSMPFVRGYLDAYPLAHTPREQLLLIDRLIHAFHWELHEQVGMSRPLAADLLAGRFEAVVDFLDSLTYGDAMPPEIHAERQNWNRKVERSAEWFRQALAASRARRGLHSGD